MHDDAKGDESRWINRIHGEPGALLPMESRSISPARGAVEGSGILRGSKKISSDYHVGE
jgi:hypothetical protein